MQFNKDTILGFFDKTQRSYEIPVYQRAYSWDKDNWATFLDDILEQIDGKNNYFYGNLLLETIVQSKKYEIIDGQQRLTTLTIFFRSIINVLKKRKIQDEDIDLNDKESLYLKSGGNIKLRPVDYDRACFDSIIIDNKDQYSVSTPSQKKIKGAKEFFEKELDKLDTKTLLNILEKVETTELTYIELEGKKDAALMFELENNRGRDLTNMEKVKSFFMYQMYVYSEAEEAETNINHVSNVFVNIYIVINDLNKLTEDGVLLYHNYAYIKGYAYRNLEDVKEVFKKQKNRIDWIKSYVVELYTSFANMKKFERSNDPNALRLKAINMPAFIYPFIIKGYKYYSEDQDNLSILFKLLEILAFRAKLINSRAKIEERLNTILLDFEGNLPELIKDIELKMNESWYWGDKNTKNYLNGNLYGNNILNYLLWEYEKSIQNKGYNIQDVTLIDEEIEHISPKTPTNGEDIETGYDVDKANNYSEEFINDHLNSIGNLMLISGSHNSSIGNKPFEQKLYSYNANPLLNQQAEIKDYIDNHTQPTWKTDSIKKRKDKILTFAEVNWSFAQLIKK